MFVYSPPPHTSNKYIYVGKDKKNVGEGGIYFATLSLQIPLAEALYVDFIAVCLFVLHRPHLHLSPQYDVLDYTNHIFSVGI